MTLSTALPGHYQYSLVVLSLLLSILASNAFLEVAERVSPPNGKRRILWLYGGAVAMGLGIWSMHCVGTVALRLPVPVLYDWPTVLVSLLVAIVASGIALVIVSQPVMTFGRSILGSVLMGGGIAAMHYIGMDAMRLPATFRYSPRLVLLSIVLAIVTSFVALQLAYGRRADRNRFGWRNISAALVIGTSIPAMHYVGGAAITFIAAPTMEMNLSHAVDLAPFGLAAISILTIVILFHVSIIARVDRRFMLQAQRLFHSQLELQTVFDSLDEGIVVLNRDQEVLRMNRAAFRFLGSPIQSLSLRDVADGLDVFLPDGSPLPTELRPAMLALNGHFVTNAELCLRDKRSGTMTVCEVSSAPIKNESGEAEQIIISYRDISERRRINEARAQLAAIVESSEDAIIGKDLNGIVTSWNAGAERIYGYTAQEMIGKNISILVPPGQEDEETTILNGIRNGETVKQMEAIRIRKDGRLIHVSLSISPIRDAANRIVGASKIARDITDKKILERQLRQGQKMEAIGQLTGGIAHDFNNLLGIIVGNLDLLERVLPNDEALLKRVRTAQKAAARGADLTRRLLAFSSREELHPEITGLSGAIQNVVELAARTLGPEIHIQASCDQALPPVYVDVASLESALLNLAVNARDAMPNGGSLSISAQLLHIEKDFPAVLAQELKPGSFAHLSVTDSGTGMSKETLERAFEPFFTTKPRNKGTGLGLAMVYGFARQSGGTARIYSEEGYGTRVSLYLPIATGQVAAPGYSGTVYPAPRHGGTVLVVDDEIDLLEIAGAYLADMGFTVFQALNGSDAIDTVTRLGDVDLMVTDVIMGGGINGVELARRVQQLSPRTKVVFSSGFPSDALEERSGTKMSGPLLRKPYQRAEFASMIQQMMTE